MCRIRMLATVVLGIVAMAGQLQAQAPTPAQAGEAEFGPRLGLGFQSSWPAYGVSGIFDVNDRLTAQAVLGAFGTLTTLSGRGLYHFQREQKHALYGFGTVGIWRHSFNFLGVSESETSPGVGGGAGVELNWREIIDGDSSESTFPPIFSSIDLGFVLASFDNFDFSGFVIGTGIHYRF